MLGAADKEEERGRVGKGPTGGPGPAAARLGVGTPGSSGRGGGTGHGAPSSALAGLGSMELSQGSTL